MNKIKTCIFVSGSGSNLRSILKCSRDYSFPIKIDLIIANNLNLLNYYNNLLSYILFLFIKHKIII